ncbi:unnamed protein product [Arctia plantaginis]|uniref:Kinesin motor domain-containing protein n=1 Tax=Arctia plantaginis TaxID=874455 RepID=A0A8S1B929_ARCPL|nr:unnamed protein product [Arctia plantaginis]
MLDQRSSDYDVSKRDIPSFIEPRPPLIQNPFMRPRPQKGTNLLELFEEDSEIEEPELVQVYLRLKPCKIPNSLYEVRSDKCLVTSLDTATAGHGRRTQHNVSKMYTFSKIFGPACNQKEIFEQVVKDNLRKLPEGHNFTLLTYGASGSGKTYTLMGTVGSPGLVPRSLEYVFKLVDAAQQPVYKPAENGAEQLNYAEQDFELQWVKRLRHVSAPLRDKYRRMSVQLHSDLTASSIDLSDRVRHYVWVSFVEIYNEAIYDLLAPPEKRTKLRIREDSSGNVYVKGATQAFVRSGEEAYDVMVAGKHNLVVAATGVHAHSSRSHCIFTITMLTETGEAGAPRSATVRLCDLAGCERARATRNTGARMLESRAINSSLHVLERCLHMLRRNQRSRHDALVPYRESKLTRLLGTGLSGAKGEAVSMVVTLNPSPEYAHETKHVLSLAAVAQDIQVNNTMLLSTLESSTQDTTISCSTEVMKLRSDNERLHFELVQAQARNKELMAAMEERQQETANTMRELVEEAKDMTRQYYEAQLEALRSEMDDMVEDYESRLSKVSKEVSSSGSGTPSRFLQTKVAQLMTEIAVLEEKLTAESLARSRAEKEVQHLRSCIEERDEKAFKDTTPEQELMDLSDSERESDEDTGDPLNESLEPVFKKELNKSTVKQNDTVSIHTIDNIDEENEEVDDEISAHISKVNDDSNSTVADEDSLNDISNKDSVINSVSKCEDNTASDSANLTYESEKNDSVFKPNESQMSTIDHGLIEDKGNELSKHLTNKSVQNSFTCRETFFVRDNTINDNDVSRDCKEKSVASSRGTYFVSGPALGANQNAETKDEDIAVEQFKAPVTEKIDTKVAKEVSESLVTKIIKSLKSNQGSDSSLTQFEQLEMASKEYHEEIVTNNSVFGDIKILKEKRHYFDNEPTKLTEKSNDEIVVTKEKRTFFDNIDVNVQPANKNIDAIKIIDDERSPPIVKDNIITDSFEPSKIKKLLGESFTKPEIITSAYKARIAKKHESVDLFESPVIIITNENGDSNIEKARQSIERLVLNQQSAKKVVKRDVIPNSPLKEILKSANIRNAYKSPMRENNTELIDSSKTLIKSPIRQDKPRSPIRLDDIKTPIELNVVNSEIILEKTKLNTKSDTDKLSLNNDTATVATKNDIVQSSTSKYIAKSPIKDVNSHINIPGGKPNVLKDLVPTIAPEPSQIKKERESVNETHVEIKSEPVLMSKSVTNGKITSSHIKKEKLETVSSVDETSVYSNDTLKDNTAEEFENIYNNITEPRATDFELLISEPVNENNSRTDKDETKYNLRKKLHKNEDGKSDKLKGETSDEVLLENQAKCESKPRKRTLRLRRKKTQGDEESDDKLKDIVNLQTEFSDVTMGVPAPQKVTKDIPSPEKGREENLPPIMGIQSCPAKSITRSRRKLFTPRAEPLEESLSQTGDSNERVYVPRPSYHRPRARRKL